MSNQNSIDLVNLFPIYVGASNLRLPTTTEWKYVNNQELRDNKNNWTSDSDTVLDHPLLLELKTDIESKLNVYWKGAVGAGDEQEIYITQSWLNWTHKGEHHHVHRHLNSMVSGVYYFRTCTNDEISFLNPNKQTFPIRIDPVETNPFNAYAWNIPVNNGDIVLFPSTLEHSVPTIEQECTRISLAFNTFTRGTFGSVDRLTHLKL